MKREEAVPWVGALPFGFGSRCAAIRASHPVYSTDNNKLIRASHPVYSTDNNKLIRASHPVYSTDNNTYQGESPGVLD